jgi:hypothetical protein
MKKKCYYSIIHSMSSLQYFLIVFLSLNELTLVAQISMFTRLFFLEFFSSQHGFIKDHTLINFRENFQPTLVLFGFRINETLFIHGIFLIYIIIPLNFKENFDHMLIPDHTFINFREIVHPSCLFRTTLLFGPLEYLICIF